MPGYDIVAFASSASQPHGRDPGPAHAIEGARGNRGRAGRRRLCQEKIQREIRNAEGGNALEENLMQFGELSPRSQPIREAAMKNEDLSTEALQAAQS